MRLATCPCPCRRGCLRVLQGAVHQPSWAAKKDIPIDIAVVCATHQEILKARITQGLFREDLYYRLRRLARALPALRATHRFTCRDHQSAERCAARRGHLPPWPPGATPL